MDTSQAIEKSTPVDSVKPGTIIIAGVVLLLVGAFFALRPAPTASERSIAAMRAEVARLRGEAPSALELIDLRVVGMVAASTGLVLAAMGLLAERRQH